MIRMGWIEVISVLCLSCEGTDGRSGLEEPLHVHDGQFVSGELPGLLPNETGDEDLPTVTSATADVAALTERLAGVQFLGSASRNAVAIGVRIAKAGDGYYLFPTGSVDAQDPNSLGWSFIADLQPSLSAGRHELLTVAFDEQGRAGPQASTSMCVRSLRPDNGNSCFPAVAPPSVVLSVQWDTPVDLDLVLVAPSGVVLSPKNPVLPGDTELSDGESSSSSVGYLAYDGNRDCDFDGRQREDVVFDELPPQGTYLVYVNLARHCGEQSVNYVVSRHIRQTRSDDTFEVDSHDLGAGVLIAAQANGGTSLGTFVGELHLK